MRISKYFLPTNIVTVFFSLLQPWITHASVLESSRGFLLDTGETAGYNPQAGTGEIISMVSNIIKFVLSFLGVIFLVLIIYGGITWMTAGGEPDKIKKATAIIRNAAIGLVIVLAAYAISYFVVSKISEATLTPATTPGATIP